MSEIATVMAAAVEEQGVATAEIARNVHEAARGTQDVSSNISGVSQAATETRLTANGLLQASDELSSQARSTSRGGRGVLRRYPSGLGAALGRND